MAAALGVIALVAAAAVWSRGTSLPDPDPGALRHFETGVEKLGDGSYTGARLALLEAVRISPDFVQAHLRLAEAQAELDDTDGAGASLLQVSQLLPSSARLPSGSLDNLAGQAERLGQLPEALALRERLEQPHRASNDQALLAFDLVNRADLLVRLSRSAEAEPGVRVTTPCLRDC